MRMDSTEIVADNRHGTATWKAFSASSVMSRPGRKPLQCCRRAGIRIGVIGDFEPAYHSHFATNAALYAAASAPKVPLEIRWLPTPTLEDTHLEKILGRWDGLIASPGSPYRSFDGMLRGIEFARTRDWPFVGT